MAWIQTIAERKMRMEPLRSRHNGRSCNSLYPVEYATPIQELDQGSNT